MFDIIESKRKELGYFVFGLIDPDVKNDNKLKKIISHINKSCNGILVGGSHIADNNISTRIDVINNESKLPVLLFPGSWKQITNNIKAMLYLNLISGRNTKYLIEEHVAGAKLIKKYNIETIPTAYILLDGGSKTSVEKVSNTIPLNMKNKENILSHALAGQHLGNKLIYFDCGSGAKNKIDLDLLEYIYKNIDIPIIAGGGIKSNKDIKDVVNAGAAYVVIGNSIEGKFK